MMNKNIKKIPMPALALYIAAIVMGIATVFNIYTSTLYIRSLIEKGFRPSSEIVEVINYYLSGVSPYVFYTLVLIALGYIISRINDSNEKVSEEDIVEKHEIQSSEDDELDELFKELEVNK